MKIADFGLSKSVEDATTSFTYTNTPSGTGGWFAPEVRSSEVAGGSKTAKVDIFMLGCCVFYTLSGGKHPYDDPARPAGPADDAGSRSAPVPRAPLAPPGQPRPAARAPTAGFNTSTQQP